MAEVQGMTAAAAALAAAGTANFLPPFANESNKQFHAQIQELEQQLEVLDLEVEENTGRIDVMSDHLKSVKQEIAYTESRLAVERKEVDGEKHLQIMSEKEATRVQTDIGRLAAQRAELSDRCAGLTAQVARGAEKLDQFKLLMNWNQEELEQWALAQRQKEEDNNALEKYRRQDDARLKELSMLQEKLTLQVAAAKRSVEEEVTETQAAQTQLDRAAEDFKSLAAERQALVGQWDEALEAMRRRDEAVQVLSNKFASNRLALKAKRAELDAQARFLEGEAANNRELEARLGLAEREVAKAREAQARETSRLAELEQQVELLRTALSKAANDLSGQEAGNSGARHQLERLRLRLEEARQRHAGLQQKLDGEVNCLGSLEGKVAQLEGLRQEGEARLKMLQRTTEDLRKDQFKAGQQLFELRSKEKELSSSIAGGQSQSRNLASRLTQLEAQMGRQQELLYNVEFNLQDMERKVARAQGHRSQDESRALNDRIGDLTGALEGVNTQHKLLMDQVKQVEAHLHEASRVRSRLATDASRAESTLTALALETETVGRALKAAAADKERALVDHDVLALQVKRLKAVLGAAADQVYSLEARKAALRLSLEERRAEIDVHRDSLKSELKLLRSDCHRLTMEVKERQLAVDRLGAKFEAVSSKNRGTDPDGGEPRSQAYYVIKAAQEREELKRQGDELDSHISKAEADLAGLEATLGALQTCNTSFNGSLRTGGPGATKELEDVRSHLDQAYDRLQMLRAQEAATAAQLDAISSSANSRAAEQAGLAATTADLERKAAEASRLASEQEEKEARARQALAKLQRQFRGTSSTTSSRPGSTAGAAAAAAAGSSGGGAVPEVSQVLSVLLGAGGVAPEEQDVALAELRASSRQMLAELKGVAAAAPPGVDLVAALEAAGFKLPAGPAGTAATSSTPGSRTSSPAGSRAGSTAGSLRSAASAASSASRASASVKVLSLEPSSSSVGDRRQQRSSGGGGNIRSSRS